MSQISAITSLSGLVSYWPCDEATGVTVNDKVASPANGTISGTGSILAPWSSPGGLGAVGLRPYSSATLVVNSASKLNVGDSFSVGMFFRRRAAVNGSLFARGVIYAAPGSEIFVNPDMESALITTGTNGWRDIIGPGAGTFADTVVKHSGNQSFRVDVNSSNGAAGFNQFVSSRPPGRYTISFWYRNDANSAGRMDLQVAYVPAAGGAPKYLNTGTTNTWITTASDVTALPYVGTTWTQYTLTFELPEATGTGFNGLQIVLKRSPGVGGGVAYSYWVDDASLKYQATNAGAYALNLGSDGVLSLIAGTGAEQRTVATSDPAFPLIDHLGWHYVVLTKAGTTTKLYIDGIDRTIVGADATLSATGLDLNLFGGDYGLQPVVGAHIFMVNRALSSTEQLAVYDSANMLPEKAADPQIRIGMCQFSATGITPGTVQYPGIVDPVAEAAACRKAHVTVMREDFGWYLHESVQGSYDWSRLDAMVNAFVAQGLSVQAIFMPETPGWAWVSGQTSGRQVPGSAFKGITVAQANDNAINGGQGTNAYDIWKARFLTFITAAVNRYKDRVFDWEIGNEQNMSIFWGPAASAPLFVDWYHSVRATILAELGSAAPNHRFIFGGFARHRSEQGATDANSYTADEFLRAVLDIGVTGPTRWGAHPYINGNGSPRAHAIGSTNYDTLHQMHDTLMEYGRGSEKMEINETGWYTANTTVAAASNGLTLPQSSIEVVDGSKINTADPVVGLGDVGGGASATGNFWIETSLGFQQIAHTGKTGNIMTGCSGGTGVISTGSRISFGQNPLTEAQQADYVTDALVVVRDYFSSFCDGWMYFCAFQHQIVGGDAFSFNGAFNGVDFNSPKAMVASLAAAAFPYERIQYASGGKFTGAVSYAVNSSWKTTPDHKLSTATSGSWKAIL